MTNIIMEEKGTFNLKNTSMHFINIVFSWEKTLIVYQIFNLESNSVVFFKVFTIIVFKFN